MGIIAIQEVQIKPTPLQTIEALVGNTPLIPLPHIGAHLPPGVQVLAKAEWFNPSGSVKDRPALNILRQALREGNLEGGRRLLDSTSGNMGIAYATFCAALGIPLTLVIPANASLERLAILRALGAELVLSDATEGTDGAIQIARRLAEEATERYFYANQYDNPANWQAHYATTAPELLQQTQGRLTHFIAGMGTSGTLMGVARYLRQHAPQVEIIAVQPDGPLHGLEGLKHMPSAIRPAIFDAAYVQRTITVSTEEAYAMVRRLARQEGLLVGISSGAAAVATLKVAETLEEGTLVAIFPDAGYKYLSEKALWGE